MPTTLTAPVVVARVQQAACSRPRRVAACPQPASASCPAHIARGLSHAGAPRHSVVVSASRTQPIVFAAATAPDWQVLAKAEIPSHIPRQDFLKQMYVWSTQHVADAQKIYGVIMEVDTIDVKQPDGEEITEAFTISLLKFIDDKNSTKVLTMVCEFDKETMPVYDQVAQDEDTGMPIMTTKDGKERFTKGKFFQVKRDRSITTPKEYLDPVNKLLKNTMEAVNKYYAFGSTFSEDF